MIFSFIWTPPFPYITCSFVLNVQTFSPFSHCMFPVTCIHSQLVTPRYSSCARLCCSHCRHWSVVRTMQCRAVNCNQSRHFHGPSLDWRWMELIDWIHIMRTKLLHLKLFSVNCDSNYNILYFGHKSRFIKFLYCQCKINVCWILSLDGCFALLFWINCHFNSNSLQELGRRER